MKSIFYDRFYLYDEVCEFLQSAQEEHPDKMRLQSIARTPEGREVFLVKLANYGEYECDEAAERKGAYFVQAGVHANEGAGTTAALHLIETLLNRPDALAKSVFYLLPRVNPDGMEYSIARCASIRSRMEKLEGVPNGLIPADLDGDGRILFMRWQDPAGTMKEMPGSRGLMVPRRPGDTQGPFYQMMTEGILENYDGGPIVPGTRNWDFNRSLPYDWKPMANSSYYPARDPEVRAVAEFMVSHPNIFAGIDLHCGTRAILRPAMCEDAQLDPVDLDLIRKVGAQAAEITGCPLIHERLYSFGNAAPHNLPGCSNSWAYHVMGISHYVIELGNGFNSLGLSSEEILASTDEQRERWIGEMVVRHERQGRTIFTPWTRCAHPQLGEVEVGGLHDGHAYHMNPHDMQGLAPRVSEFALRHASMKPELHIVSAEITALGSDLYRIRATLQNTGELGTTVMKGAAGPLTSRDVRVTLRADGAIEYLSRPAIHTRPSMTPLDTMKLEWFVRTDAPESLEIHAEHPKAGETCQRVKK